MPAPYFEGDAFTAGPTYGKTHKVRLSDYKGKYLVLFFYPMDFTFVCPTEIIEFSDKAKMFRDVNCEVVGCSVDSVFSHEAYCNQPRDKGGLGKMDIPLLSDLTKQISKDYGCYLDFSENAGVSLRYFIIFIIRKINLKYLQFYVKFC